MRSQAMTDVLEQLRASSTAFDSASVAASQNLRSLLGEVAFLDIRLSSSKAVSNRSPANSGPWSRMSRSRLHSVTRVLSLRLVAVRGLTAHFHDHPTNRWTQISLWPSIVCVLHRG